ncbi:MAG: iron-sulfur cluster-binding protein [Phycisphaerae bacterium]|nr:iron-sulfur cluster-binding protein [Phycisphaerae bacterium]
MSHGQTTTGADFHARSAAAMAQPGLSAAVSGAVLRQYEGRKALLPELGDPLAVRQLAAEIKSHTLQHLDQYLSLFCENVRRHGGHVHFARTGEQAGEIIRQIARDHGVKRIVKAKSMASEEIHLTAALEADGIETVETDLGEFIVQVGEDKPSHIVTPVIHMTTPQIARLFEKVLGTPYTEDPEVLTRAARVHLREKFRAADMGICGCNVGVAETGTVAIVTNEGNGRLSTTHPRVVVSLMGIEKLVPTMKDLAVIVKLLAKSSTGQRLTVYTNLMSGSKRPADLDGPEEFHVVLLDRGRTRILASEYQELLRCIRCGACLNACPVYRTIGGHAYNSVYPGPIGSLLTPLFEDFSEYKDLPNACSLCEACLDACPVRISLPALLIRMRDELRREGHMHWFQRLAFRAWRWGMLSHALYGMGNRMGRLWDWLAPRGWHRRAMPPFSIWTKYRDLPVMAKRPFFKMWDDLNPSA